MNHMEGVARRKVGGTDQWEACKWKRIGEGNDFLLAGGVPRLRTKGKNKGSKTWDGPLQEAVVTGAEFDAEHARYEADTGNCGDCGGSGEVLKRWSVESGAEMKVCPRCNGTRKSPEANHPSFIHQQEEVAMSVIQIAVDTSTSGLTRAPDFSTLTLNQLLALNESVVGAIRERRVIEAQGIMRRFQFGEVVKVARRGGGTFKMKIESFNSKTVSGLELDGGGKETSRRWRVSPSLISPLS